ncbi:hypothetical protein [Flavobacterium psychrotrophum]|uniref:hypothetical protein n=1 Tax=Flavobacterium psychrotrophum TaxID=2294119 RepID=UPI0013C52D35|nr:hypothetical protein [Flavobacterium psychrotrophum]
MVSRQFPVFTKCLAVSLALLITVQAGACGWGDDYETLRLAFFRPVTDDVQKFSPFFYSEHYFNEYDIHSDADRHRNCNEWKKRLGNAVDQNNIYELQYKTVPEKFQSAYALGTLAQVFAGNTFVKALLKPENKALLDYFAFAKQMEYTGNPQNSKWESWDEDRSKDWWERAEDLPERKVFKAIEDKLPGIKDKFLQQRYAFMLIRYGRSENILPLYDSYFASDSTGTVLKPWALLFRAYMTENKAEQNYYLSQCFDTCEEKVIAVSQAYNYEEQEATMAFAKNDHERAVILALGAMRNPGPGLDVLKKVYGYDPQSPYLKLLTGREINKLEDWVLFSQIKDSGPDVSNNYYSDSDDEFQKNRQVNYIKDMAYLGKVREYLISIYEATPSNNKDYLAAGIAHLSFIDDNMADGYKYASAISDKAPDAVKVQKYIELALVVARQGDIQDTVVQQKLVEAFDKLEDMVKVKSSYNKSMYSLLVVLSSEYNKQGDMATAGLLFLKSQTYKYNYGESDMYWTPDDLDKAPAYEHIAYFDRFAALKDMDKVVALIDKKDKTPFEAFICQGTTTNRNFYLDLKGTIAFRQNNLPLAYDIFKEIPDSFYKNEWDYKYYLNEDPFYPKVLNYAKKGNPFEYNFNKAKLLKRILELQKKTDTESYMQLAHAYYNLSYRGNSWLMQSYYQGYMYYDAYFGKIAPKKEEGYMAGNYKNFTLAKYYYKKALDTAKSDEHRAMASLMLYVINNPGDYESRYWGEEVKKHEPGDYLNDFYGKYKNTKVFKRYSCPELEYYLK